MLRFVRSIKTMGFLPLILIVVMFFWLLSSIFAPTKESSHHIAAGSYEALMVGSYFPERTYSRRRGNSRPPVSIAFSSKVGPVEAYLVRVSLAHSLKQVNYIKKIKEDFASGIVPSDAISLSGLTGKFWVSELPDNKQLPNYMLLIRSKIDTEVTVLVRY